MNGLSVTRLAPLAGLAFIVLFTIGNGIWGLDQPTRDAGAAEILSFYEDTSTRIVIGGSLSAISVFFLVWFGAVLRDRLADAEGSERSGLPGLAFAGTVVAAAIGLGAETINMAAAIRADDGELTADTALTYFDVSYALGAPAAAVAFAMIAIPVAIIALRTGRISGRVEAWVVLLAAIAAQAFVPFALPLAIAYVPLLIWLTALSTRLYRERVSS